MIYYLRNNNLILPHYCFLAYLVQSFNTGSKTVSVINGKVSPSASYTSYKNWMLLKGSKTFPSPVSDSVAFFDIIGTGTLLRATEFRLRRILLRI